MLPELLRVFLCLGAGEALTRTGVLAIPGSVIGLVLLLGNLLIMGRLPDALGRLADTVLAVLGMLFVPAGVGVLAYADLLRTELVPVVAAIVGGTIVTVGVTALVADRLSRMWLDRLVRRQGGATNVAR